MGLLVGEVIDRTRQELLGAGRLEMNTLGAAINDAPTAGTVETISFSFPLNGITPTSFLTIDEEDFYVFNTNVSEQQATVARGENSTVPTTHNLNARVYINDPFPRSMVMNCLQDEIRSWGPQVYQVATIDTPLLTDVVGYDLGFIGTWFRVIEARMTPFPDIDIVDSKGWRRLRFKEIHSAPTADFPSGNGIILMEPDGADAWNWNLANVNPNLHIVYSLPFNVDDSWTEQTDLVVDCGLDPSDQDIPQLGAMWRLMRGREARRALTNIADDPRQAAEIPPLYITKTAEAFKAERDSRLDDAQTRLAMLYPLRMTA